jgi:hypothetical protein
LRPAWDVATKGANVKRRQRHGSWFDACKAAALLPALLATACASDPPPYEQLAVSKMAIEDAINAGAADDAADQLASARNKLAKARALAADDEQAAARRLAEEAEADARLAATRARAARAQRELSEANHNMGTLGEHLVAPSGH